jgi:hypothetical protein
MNRTRTFRKRLFRWFQYLLVMYCMVGFLSYLTNPFTKYTLVQVPFQTKVESNEQISLVKETNIRLRTSRLYSYWVWVKTGYHIVQNVYTGGKRAKAETVQDLIRDIHKLRFDPDEPFLISGDHFSMLYIRSLGIFYHTLLDPRTALDTDDWLNRQKIYLQTTAYALDVFSDAPKLSTTIVPVGVRSVSLMNVFAPPSDSLYSLFYALDVMLSTSTMEKIYPMAKQLDHQLQTQTAAKYLLETYKESLQKHYKTYTETVADPQTGLIKKDILLSGTKDSNKRQSAFYDNVILWRTHQLAQQLGVTDSNEEQLTKLKADIIQTYWQPEMGCFLEDLSEESVSKHHYSSDWLIVLMTGFLDPHSDQDRQYYLGCVSYIQEHELDQPFGLKYQDGDQTKQLYGFVRFGAPQYAGPSIWSNWGMEYTKLLVLLHQTTQEKAFLEKAKQQIDAYTENILKYRCYPEVYNTQGKMFRNALYKSVCQTGWVVTYEQAKAMVDSELEKTATQSSGLEL